MEVLVAIFGVLALVSFLFWYSAAMSAWMVYCYAGWFLPIAFPEYHVHFTFVQCFAVSFLLSLFKNTYHNSIKKEYREESSVWMPLVWPWIALLFGYIVYQFIK